MSNKTQWIKACFYDNLLSLLTVGRNHSFPDLDNLHSTLHPELNFLPLKLQTGHSLWRQELPFLADHKELFTWRASTKTQTWDIQDFYCLGIYFRFLILADFCTCTILLFPFPKGTKEEQSILLSSMEKSTTRNSWHSQNSKVTDTTQSKTLHCGPTQPHTF